MRIILNADDFGFDDLTVDATLRCFQAGGLSSATIMPNMPSTARAIAFARTNPAFSFGIHLTFVCDSVEAPVSDPASVPALVDERGRFWPSPKVRRMALRNLLPVDQLEREMAAQIGLLRDHGVRVSHVDSHGHLHKFGPFIRAMRAVLPRFGITRVRNVQDTYLRRPFKSPTFWLGRAWRRRIQASFDTTQHFFMPTNLEDARRMPALVPLLRGESIEVGGHPGTDRDWQIAEATSLPLFAKEARAAGHSIVTWHEL
jgi:predicted glycoside hydrolase/deacetylase ChbG (UPF0249 family)